MNRYAVAAVLSGAFFGLTGLFTRTLTGAGLSTMGILSIRCSVAALCFFCTALGDIRQLKMHKKDFWLFAAVGILGQGMFSFCYYNAINMMSISTACILMYLSPVFVTIMAHFVFKDGISETQMENLKNKIYYGKATRADIARVTRRLGDEIAAVYGFHIPKRRTRQERSER